MQDTSHQKVLPLLATDPLYLRQLQEEAIIFEVKKALEPVLREKMVQIVSGMADARFRTELGSLIAETTSHVIGNLEGEISQIRSLLETVLRRHQEYEDSADWWKRGTEPDEDEDIPF